MDIGLEILIILLLILLNGVFAMSELALVSARRARLAVLERKGLAKAEYPHRLVLTPAGLSYDTGLADEILHRSTH